MGNTSQKNYTVNISSPIKNPVSKTDTKHIITNQPNYTHTKISFDLVVSSGSSSCASVSLLSHALHSKKPIAIITPSPSASSNHHNNIHNIIYTNINNLSVPIVTKSFSNSSLHLSVPRKSVSHSWSSISNPYSQSTAEYTDSKSSTAPWMLYTHIKMKENDTNNNIHTIQDLHDHETIVSEPSSPSLSINSYKSNPIISTMP
eukprot:800333_1